MREENPKLFKHYIKKYFPINYGNSFFILNKIDLMDDKEKEEKIFENEMLVKKLGVNLKDTTIHLLYLSCEELTKEIKQYEDFQSYLKYLLTQGGKGENNLLKYLKEKMVKDFKLEINKIGKEEPNDGEKAKIREKIRELKNQRSNFKIFLTFKEYFNYSKAFDELKKLFSENADKSKEQKTKKYQELYDCFNKSFTNSFKNFLNIPKDQDMINRIKNIVKYIDQISKENKDTIIKTQKYLDLLYKDLNNNINLSINQFNNLKPLVEKLSEEGKSFSTFENLKKEFELIEFFIKKDKKLRIPLFGGYSTGKSSLLNCIIGARILPEGNKVTTRKIIVIRNNEENKFTISKTDLVQTNGEYYCFKDGDIINDLDTPGKIYDFLEKENEDKELEGNLCYLLTAPIFLFKKMKLSKEILNKIEFIDFPGIDAIDEKINEKFNNLADLSDTFIFVNECNLIKNGDNIKIMQRIINRIENRRFNFDYNSCLFVLNKADGENKDINKEKKKKEIEEILFSGNKFSSFLDFFKKKENPEITVSIFSCYLFLEYLSFYDKFKDFEKYINANIEEIEQKENDNDLIGQLKENINDKLEMDFENYESKEEKINEEYFSKLKSCLINKGINEKEINEKTKDLKNIIKNYKIMENNLEKNQYYIDSKVGAFITDLEKKFIIAKNMTDKQFEEKIKKLINTLQTIFRLLQQKSINKTVCDISKTREKFGKEMNELYALFSEYSSILNTKIDTVFKNLIERVNTLINLGNSEDTTTYQLKNKIEEFKNFYSNEIKLLDDFIKEQLVSFHYRLENKINTELINFGVVQAKQELSYWKMGLISAWGSIAAVSGAVLLFIGGVIMFIGGGIGSLIKLIRGKNPLIKDLKDLSKELEIQWDSTHFKTNKILTQHFNKSNENLKMIYDTQMAEINEKKVQELYEEFIHIIGDKYVGEKKEGKKHGYGIYYWFDGSKYEGYYENDLREGYGKMKWEEGGKYEGYWKQNEREGLGRIFFSNGNKYEGEYKNSQEDGFGMYIWKDGSKYIGDLRDNDFNGIGTLIYDDGDIYEGEYKNGKKHGIGIFYYKDGRKYEGEWKYGKKNGRGIFYINKEKKYEGLWEENRKILVNYIENDEYIKNKKMIGNNKIKIEYVDGDIYEGEYNQETKIIEGIGSYYFNHGAIYKGQFEDNLFSGKGLYSYDGTNISGIYKKGKLNGQGEINMKNGNTLKGKFKDGKKEGIFLFYDKSNNETISRIYEDDDLKTEFKDN